MPDVPRESPEPSMASDTADPTDATQSAGSAESSGHPAEHRPRSRAPWLLGGGALLALVAGGVAIGTVNATVYSPEAQVEAYLEALAAGDGGTALALSGAAGSTDSSGAGDAPLAEGTATTLLQGEPLASGFAALGELEVSRGEDTEDGSARVHVRYTVDGTEHESVFPVDHAGRDWLFFDDWQLAPIPLQTLVTTPVGLPPEAAGSALGGTVNGAAAPLLAGGGTAGEATNSAADTGHPRQRYAVLPPLVVEASFESTYLTAEPTRTVVNGSPGSTAQGSADGTAEPVSLELPLAYTEEVSAEADRQLAEYLSGCTEQKVLHPAGCPIGYDTVNRIPPDSIAWSIAGDPSLDIVPLPAEGGDPTAVAPLEATAVLTLQEIDLVTGAQTRVEHEAPFTLPASLEVTPESVRYTPETP